MGYMEPVPLRSRCFAISYSDQFENFINQDRFTDLYQIYTDGSKQKTGVETLC